jgi:hypothetical protein
MPELNAESVFITLLAWFVFRETSQAQRSRGGTILTGLTILSWAWASEVSGMAPALCARSACFCWPVNNNLTKKVSLGAAIWIASLKEFAWLDYYRRRFLIFASVSHFPD